MFDLFRWKPLKNDENAFYFTVIAPFIPKIFKFLFFFVMWETDVVKNLRLTSNVMPSSTGKQIITIHILPNISRNKGNRTLKFGQLIKDNFRNILLQKSYKKWERETSFRPLFVKAMYKLKASSQHFCFYIFW